MQARVAQLDYSLFEKLIRAAFQQPEYREAYGVIWWSLLWHFRFVAFRLYRRRDRSNIRVAVVEKGDRVLAAVGILPTGEMSTLIVVGAPAERRLAMRMLIAQNDDEIARSKHRLWTMTGWNFRSLCGYLERRGFVRRGSPMYLTTLPLGPMTFSWLRRGRLRIPGVRAVPQVYLVGPDRDESAS